MKKPHLVRSRAPLRLGFAGGGTDVAPYSDLYGGYVLNATINLYAHCTIERTRGDTVKFIAPDLGQEFEEVVQRHYPLTGDLILHKAIYNRIIAQFHNNEPIPLTISTWADAPPGSGLGTSSTLVVAIISAFKELLALPLGDYDIAHLAYEIERVDCQLAGGKQDQYAATFGGFNFMEFYADDRVVVNPLRLRKNIENELLASLLLFYTGRSRESAAIIKEQIEMVNATTKVSEAAVNAMHRVKKLALEMKEELLRGNIEKLQELLRISWIEKKKMAVSISNNDIDQIADEVISSGAKAVKISGAGGGGFMMIFTDPIHKYRIADSLESRRGKLHKFSFTHEGVESWIVK